MLLSQGRELSQLPFVYEGTHPVLCRTRQLSPVSAHLHVRSHRTFVPSFSAYQPYAFKARSCMSGTCKRKSAPSRQVLRRWYYGGYPWESRSPPRLIKKESLQLAEDSLLLCLLSRHPGMHLIRRAQFTVR